MQRKPTMNMQKKKILPWKTILSEAIWIFRIRV